MNILLFVMSFLMVISIMTYARLDSYLGSSLVQFNFKNYMEKTERSYANEQASLSYDDEVGSSREKNENDENKKNPASPKLSFNLFVDKEERLKHSQELNSHLNLAKNLIYFLYGNQPFFLKMEEKRPDFVNEIFSSLIRATESAPSEEKLNTNNVEEIATIDLGDFELNEVFTKMLKGSAEKIFPLGKSDKKRVSEASLYRQNFQPKEGYYSLLDFITLKKNKLKIRVFLASPQLLMAIYGKRDLVKEILDARSTFYKNLKHVPKQLQEEAAATASQDFKRQFQNLQLSSIPESILNFGVSGTNPKKYLSF